MSHTALRLRFFAWLALMLTVGALFFSQPKTYLETETDILALLPGAEHDPVVDHALNVFSEQAGRKVLFLIGAPDATQGRKQAASFAQTLQSAGSFATVKFEMSNTLADTLKAYVPYRSLLLSEQDRQRLQAGEAEALYKNALRALYTPAGFMRVESPAQDPLGLLSDFLLSQVPPLGAVQINQGALSVTAEDGKRWWLVVVELADSAFATATQAQVMPVITAATTQAKDNGAEVFSSGLLPHAAYAAQKAHQEVSTFGLVSLLGTIVLLLFVHRSMRPVLMSATSILLGVMAALMVSHWVFGRVHLLTLVFGSSLIGVAADYSTYFLTDAFRVPRVWKGPDALRQVAPGILLGLLTALTAYAVLFITPFPALRQIAVFSATGLVVACGCVLCLFPLLRPPQAPSVAPRIARGLDALQPRPRSTRTLILAALIFLLAVTGLVRLRVVNDIHLLQSSPPHLIESEKRVRALLNSPADSQFLLVTGDTEEALLQHEEQLRPQLDRLQAQGVIRSYAAVTRALPSQKTQNENAILIAALAAPNGALTRMQRTLGLSADVAAQQRREAQSSDDARLLPKTWLTSAASASYRHLWLGRVGGAYASVVTLGGIRDLAPLQNLHAQFADVRLVDKVGDISALLARYQRLTTLMVALGSAAVLLLFTLRYGFAGALRVVLSPVLASLMTFGLFGWFGEPVNLFNTFALLLVLGIGIDYAIFLREGRASPQSSLIAVLVCAATALLSFGMLAFSSTPFIHSFGLTMLLGIMLAVVAALLLGFPRNSNSSKEISS